MAKIEIICQVFQNNVLYIILAENTDLLRVWPKKVGGLDTIEFQVLKVMDLFYRICKGHIFVECKSLKTQVLFFTQFVSRSLGQGFDDSRTTSLAVLLA